MSWKRASLWVPPIAYMAAIFHFSSQSQPMPILTEHVWDKLLHLVEYAGLAALLCRAYQGEGLTWTAATLLAVATTMAYGATDEWHQSFVPMRDASVRDWMADALGGTTGAMAMVWANRASRRLHRPRH